MKWSNNAVVVGGGGSGGMVVHGGGAIRDLLVEAFPISFTDSLLSSLGRGFYYKYGRTFPLTFQVDECYQVQGTCTLLNFAF